MRLDRNSLTLFNYALLGVFVLLLTINQADADIYENAQGSVEAKMIISCEWEETAQDEVDEFNRINGLPKEVSTVRLLAAYVKGTRITQHETYCSMDVGIEYEEYRQNSGTGEWYFARKRSASGAVYGSLGEAPSCLNLGNKPDGSFMYPDHTILHLDENGAGRCYTPLSLADADTCEAKDENNAYESHMTKLSDVSCLEKDDGSICPVKLGTSITLNSDSTTYNFYSFDESKPPQSCYESNYVDPPQSEDAEELMSNLPSNQGECHRINGTDSGMICNENPSNVCDQYGNCNEGCGTVQSRGEQIFACFSEDFDGDGVPDFKDPDIDGDGIHNNQDTDKDGDGVDDSEYTYGSGGGNSLSTIESLLGQIAQNTQGGSGSVGGNSQGVIDAIGELGEQLEESTNVIIGEKGTLYSDEQAQFEIDEATQKLNAKIEQIKEHFSGLLSIGSGAGSFSGCFDIAQINGSKHGGCIDEYADEMSMVAVALLFIFALISVVIILR